MVYGLVGCLCATLVLIFLSRRNTVTRGGNNFFKGVGSAFSARVGVKGCAFGSNSICAKRVGNHGPGNGKGAIFGGKSMCRKRCMGKGHRNFKVCAFPSKRGCRKR